jgi:hypothetical protein
MRIRIQTLCDQARERDCTWTPSRKARTHLSWQLETLTQLPTRASCSTRTQNTTDGVRCRVSH